MLMSVFVIFLSEMLTLCCVCCLREDVVLKCLNLPVSKYQVKGTGATQCGSMKTRARVQVKD